MSVIAIILLFPALRTAAQTASQFPLGANNWVGTTGNPNNGDRDSTVVLFFEVPDTAAGPLYFGIRNPGNPGTGAIAQNEQNGGDNSYWYLIGGQGALSDPGSQLLLYNQYPSTQPFTGTTLVTFSRTTQDENWVYFPGVQPSQGEHIGNKYYFKVVLQTDANVAKNAFQADVSSSNGGAPVFVTGARSFSFNWSPFVSSNGAGSGRTFDFHPFVTSGTTGNLSVNTWDFDNAVTSATTFDILGTNLGTFTPGAGSTQATANYAIGAQTNGTWHISIVGNQGGTQNDLTEVWNTNGTTSLRTYANSIPAQVPDHVTLTYSGSTLPVGGSGQVMVQVVDSSGNPSQISENVWVTVSGSAQITAANAGSVTPAAGVLVTTDGNGMGSVTLTDAVGETVAVNATTNGSSGSSTLGAANNSVNVSFSANAPTLSSASATLIVAAGTSGLPVVTVAANGGAFIASANGTSIRIPPTLGISFNTAITPTYGGSASGRVNGGASGYPNSTTLFIALGSSFSTTDTLTITGLQVVTPANAFSTGRLQLSYDGGASYSVSDNQTITVNTVGAWTWTAGGGSGSCSNGANWNTGTQPAPNADVTINNTANQPTVDLAIPSLHNLTVNAPATLNAGGFNVTVTGTASIAGTFNGNTGIITFEGNVSGAGTYVASSGANYFAGNLTIGTYTTSGGIARFNGTAAQSTNGYTFANLTKMGGPTLAVNGTLIVTGTLTTNSSADVVDVGAQNFTIGTLNNTGTLALDGSQATQTITFMDAAKGTVRYKGAGGGNVRFSEPVAEPGGNPIGASDFTCSAGAVTGLTRITVSGNATSEALLTLSVNVRASDMIDAATPATISLVTAVEDMAAAPNAAPAGAARTHRVTDVGLGLAGSAVVEPVWAKDQSIQATVGSGIGLIRVFNGAAWLRRQSLTLEAHLDATLTDNPATNLWWDVAGASMTNGFWLPPFTPTSGRSRCGTSSSSGERYRSSTT